MVIAYTDIMLRETFKWIGIICIGKGPSIWDTYTSQPGIVAEGATGQTACNSYYFYQKDVDALKSLNVNVSQPGYSQQFEAEPRLLHLLC